SVRPWMLVFALSHTAVPSGSREGGLKPSLNQPHVMLWSLSRLPMFRPVMWAGSGDTGESAEVGPAFAIIRPSPVAAVGPVATAPWVWPLTKLSTPMWEGP